MRLVDATVKGFRRLRDLKVSLEDRVVAVVGPNEAGKTSLLQALSRLSDDLPFDPTDVSRGSPPSATRIEAKFCLSSEEQGELAAVEFDGPPPRWFVVAKEPGGKRRFSLVPAPCRRKEQRPQLQRALEDAKWAQWPEEMLDKELRPSAGRPPQVTSLRDGLTRLSEAAESEEEILQGQTFRVAELVVSRWEEFEQELPEDFRATAAPLRAALDRFHRVEGSEHPSVFGSRLLQEFLPRFLLFGEDERLLRYEYTVADLESPHAALRNLLGLSGVAPPLLRKIMLEGDHGARAHLEEVANRVLAERFGEAWKQSDVVPHLQIDRDVVRIQISAPGTYSPIVERSDGLRSFVALCAFVRASTSQVAPILLVDEIEAHLHYDAQADVVQVLETQSVAAQVIYSTHSAGSLPSDLGGGIRALRPLRDRSGADSGASESFSIWSEQAGISPLLLALGASVLVAAPSRRAVIGEGVTDVILLPVLFEIASGQRAEFQIAPGLAEVPRRKLRELEMEAPKVAYLVDGDREGTVIRSRLEKQGVEPSLIVQLMEGSTPEDYPPSTVFCEAVAEELRRSHGNDFGLSEDAIPQWGRVRWLAGWCKSRKIKAPNRKAIARLTRERLHPSGERLEERKSRALCEVLERLNAALTQ